MEIYEQQSKVSGELLLVWSFHSRKPRKAAAHTPQALAVYFNTREKGSRHSQTGPSTLISDYLKTNNMLVLQRQRPGESLEQDIHSTKTVPCVTL